MTLVISSAVLREYLDVLSRFVTPALLQEWVDALTDPTRVTMVEPAEQIDVVRADPSDNRFLECALAAHADAVISGDHHLLTLKTFRDIPILTPSAFLEQGS